MSIRCKDLHETLSAYVDGEESKHETIAARAHLESCAPCRAMVEDWQAMDDALAREHAIDAPVVTERRAAAAPERRGSLHRFAAAAAAVVIVATAVVAGLGRGDGASTPAGSVGPVPLVTLPADREEPAPVLEARPTATPTERPSPAPTAEPTEPPPAKHMPTVTRGSNGRLVLVLEIERAFARAGETLWARSVLRNVTDEPLTFSSPEDSPVDLVIRDADGNAVWRRSEAEGWTRAMVNRTLQPGEQLVERLSFMAPEPGGYLLAAQCICLPEDFDPHDPRASFAPEDKERAKTSPFETNPLRFVTGRDR